MRKINDNLWSFDTRDLMRVSSCEHCTTLSIARELGIPEVLQLAAEYKPDQQKTLAQKYGDEYEAELQRELVAALGSDLVRSPEKNGDPSQTIDLMTQGAAVIYQGGLRQQYDHLLLSVRPDFLVRADFDLVFEDGKLSAVHDPERDSTGYIVWDAKFGSSAKPTYMIQVAMYVDALEAIGFKAENARHGLILGDRSLVDFEEVEIVPAMLLARDLLAERVAEAIQAAERGDLSAYQVGQLSLHCKTNDSCEICEYPDLCAADRVATDDLILVANINRSQIAKLQAAGITTVKELAEATDEQRPEKFVVGSFEKLRKQAAMQVKVREAKAKAQNGLGEAGSEENVQGWQLVADPEIAFLPPRSKNDIFFDMEGFPYFKERGGLEYLFGNYDWNDKFTEFWAHDRVQEKQAFIDFVTWAHGQMQADPNAHIYHYASYEVTALNKLATRYGVMEDEVRWLIENHKLVDLYAYVRNSLIVGEESYSIKKLEPHYGFIRVSDVKNAQSSIDEYDNWREVQARALDEQLDQTSAAELQAEADRIFAELREYNIEDVKSTRALYEWLSTMDGAHSRFGEDRDDSPKGQNGGDEEVLDPTKAEIELAALRAETASLFGLVADHEWGVDQDADYRARIWLALTHSILFYKREEVMFYRDVRVRVDSEDEQLVGDRKALLTGDVNELSRLPMPKEPGKRAVTQITYEFELPQDTLWKPEKGQKLFVRYSIAGGRKNYDYGSVKDVSGGLVTFTRTARNKFVDCPPTAILHNDFISAGAKQDALGQQARTLTQAWQDPKSPAPTGHATFDLLMRRSPSVNLADGLPKHDPADYLPAVSQAILNLQSSTLAIQGPPGSGKTYLASRSIEQLVEAGYSVGVVANSHSAVENLLFACIEAGVNVSQIVKRAKSGEREVKPWQGGTWSAPKVSNYRAGQRLKGEGYVIGGTAWAFSAVDMQSDPFDFIFIEEAAQFSLVDAIAVGGAAKNLVLLGDPQQLAQVVQAVHPGGVDNSALGHYMGEHEILPAQLGYFVEVTRRMHPKVNEPVSKLSYQGRLTSHEVTKLNQIANQPQGLVRVAVKHEGNASRSLEEVAEVLRLVTALRRDLDAGEILVVAPYNAQVDAIREALDAASHQAVQVGTVDKFQGREAMAVIVSFAASSAADAPRGLEFLLDRNRLNVAVSRAKANCYLVHSPNLTKAQFKTAEDVRAVSRLQSLLNHTL